MKVLGDVIARERRSPAVALRDDANGRSYTYHDFCTTAYKVGNFLRYLGVDGGDAVSVAPVRLPEPVLTFFGAGLLGAVTCFERDPSARVTVVEAARARESEPGPGSKLVVFGGPPEGTGVEHWEKQVWSENPGFPPTPVDPDAPLLADAGRTYSHAAVLGAARSIVDEFDLDESTEVVVRGALSTSGTVAGGVVAPLVAGGTCVFPDEDTVGDVSIGDRGPEDAVAPPGSLF